MQNVFFNNWFRHGEDGASAYQSAQKVAGFKRTIAEWLVSLKASSMKIDKDLYLTYSKMIDSDTATLIDNYRKGTAPENDVAKVADEYFTLKDSKAVCSYYAKRDLDKQARKSDLDALLEFPSDREIPVVTKSFEKKKFLCGAVSAAGDLLEGYCFKQSDTTK